MSEYLENLKIASYAATSGRKTLQIGNLIESLGAENVGIISCEHGLGTIGSLVNREFVNVVEDMAQLRKAWGWARDKFPRPDQWVCIDGGSRVLQWIRDDIFGNTQRAYEMMLEGVKPTDMPASIRAYCMYITKGTEINSQPMWIRVGNEADRLLNSFVRLPCSMYWTFWEEFTQLNQYDKGPPWHPDTPGKGSFDAVKGAFDFIFRLVKSEDGSKSNAVFVNDTKQYAKLRDDWRGGIKVPPMIPDFNLADFVNRLRGDGFGTQITK